METETLLKDFLQACTHDGKSPQTVQTYSYRLRHFASENPELPTDTVSIEKFLKARRETPGHRGDCFKVLQNFYNYIARAYGIQSPVPPRKMGRPLKFRASKNGQQATFEANPETDGVLIARSVLASESSSKVVQGGSPVTKSTSMSTSRALELFLNSLRTKDCSTKWIRQQQVFLGNIADLFPELPHKTEDIEGFLANSSWSNATRRDYYKWLKWFYIYLEKRFEIPNPLKNVDLPVLKPKLRRVLTREDLISLMAHVRSHMEKCIIITLFDTKCRRGELISMTRENIFPDHAIVTGKRGEREVSLSFETYMELCQLAKSGPLFHYNGKRVSGDYIRLLVHGVMERAGLKGEKLGPHIIRHSAAVQHIVEGGDLLSLQDELGHTDLRMTGHYSRLAKDQVRKKHQELNLVSRIFGKVPPGGSATQDVVPPTNPVEQAPQVDLNQGLLFPELVK
jgi:integrase